MNIVNQPEFDALTRRDFQVFCERVFAELNPGIPYLDNFHISIMTAKLEAARHGETKRLIINVPPRSLKSVIASVAFPAWLLGQDPTTKVIAVSYAQDLAEDLSRDCRAIMQSPWYRHLFPATRLDPSRLAVGEFETTNGGFRRATSVGGSLTGFGADYIIIDDPTKPDEALSEVERHRANRWYSSTAVTRLNAQKEGVIIVVMQRLHEDDFVGHILSLDQWDVVSFPAIALEDELHKVETPYGTFTHHRREGEALHPERESLQELHRLRHTLGPEFFSAQYLQSPTPPGGGLIKADWFRRYTPDERPAKFDQIFQSWDTAGKAKAINDPSVCTTWGTHAGGIWLLDVYRGRLEYPELKRAIIAQARHHRAELVLIEDKGSGISLLQDLTRDGLKIVQGVLPVADKVMRMRMQTAAIENGFVHLPKTAAWLPDYLHELMMFPKGRHDDQVDSTSQALQWFSWKPPEPGLITYYERLRKHQPNGLEEKRIVTLTCNGMTSTVYTAEGNKIMPDPDGLFRMRWSEAKPLLQLVGWRLVEDT